MLTLIFEIIMMIFICFSVDLLTYKYIRYLDKKEREKLAKKESEYIKNLIEEMSTEKQSKEKENELNLLDF